MAKKRKTKKKASRAKKPPLRVRTQSSQTGIVHDASVEALVELSRVFAERQSTHLQSDLINSTTFWDWLTKQELKENFIEYSKDLYRIVYGGYNALSAAGNLAKGGRLNVGGAQFSNQSIFPNLQMTACLYAATTIECARSEAGEPLGKVEEYKLTFNKAIKLWDLETIISSLDYPSLRSMIEGLPFGMDWGLQKAPLVSQLIGQYLRSIGGDGILSKSTKGDGQVVAIFCKDDSELKMLLNAERL